MSEACHHDAVLVEPSANNDLNEAALSIFAEGRIPERCQSPGYDHHWLGKYLYSGDGPTDGRGPACEGLPKWPSRNLKEPMKARWNVPARMK